MDIFVAKEDAGLMNLYLKKHVDCMIVLTKATTVSYNLKKTIMSLLKGEINNEGF